MKLSNSSALLGQVINPSDPVPLLNYSLETVEKRNSCKLSLWKNPHGFICFYSPFTLPISSTSCTLSLPWKCKIYDRGPTFSFLGISPLLRCLLGKIKRHLNIPSSGWILCKMSEGKVTSNLRTCQPTADEATEVKSGFVAFHSQEPLWSDITNLSKYFYFPT